MDSVPPSAMTTEFRKAILPREIGSLITFDRKAFPSDHFSRADWLAYESYWMIVATEKSVVAPLKITWTSTAM
jgi:hypothetical protein